MTPLGALGLWRLERAMFGDKETTRNLILAAVLSMAVVFLWQIFFLPPPPEPGTQPEDATALEAPTGTAEDLPPLTVIEDRTEALATTERVRIDNGAVHGSISLTGALLDDLHLDDYRVTLDEGSDTVTLLNPLTGDTPYYASFGWENVREGTVTLPDDSTVWSVESGDVLAPGAPIVLAWDNGEGLIFRQRWEMDERYMFTVTQSVENTTEADVVIVSRGIVERRGLPDLTNFYILHEGAIGVFDGELQEIDYDDIEDYENGSQRFNVDGGAWLGFTDKYWMTVLIPPPGTIADATLSVQPGPGRLHYRTRTRFQPESIPAGETREVTTRLFAGAKELGTIRDYESQLGIDRFDDAIDWGWFYFLTKPFALLLKWLNGLIGNMGVAIIAMTLIIKAVLFPLAYKSFVSMSRMKKLQPEMQKIKERAGDDRMKMQQEMVALYKKEKVNPAAGCLPILLQIPIFFALYKVIFVTLELRHAPFFGWIQDLSAPDPTSWMNLFGALPFEVPGVIWFLSIGVFPILMGITMWMQQKLNPAPTDKTQAAIFAWLPWIFMFMLGHFAAGLVIYWVANNVITFAQQYIIMRSQGVEVDFFGNVKKSFKRKKPAS